MSESSSQDPAACPVDHKSREAWLSQARAASASQQTQAALPPDHPPIVTGGGDAQESCPVDHNAREAWMQQARAASQSTAGPVTAPAPAQPRASAATSWTSSILSYLPFGASTSPSQTASSLPPQPGTAKLDTNRIISSIPRSSLLPGAPADGAATHSPANNEQETGADKKSGNWIYPSEKMFFEAMKRKGHDPVSTDMQTIVPIHNAVNEKAWEQIKEWEAPYLVGTSCGGPRLSSFSGLSTKMSPKATVNTWLGYQAPFDRHDWIVDRCGQEIEYVIDFYAGRARGDGKPSFYLDVRPKLNSWEGVKMRAFRSLGVM
ncbi:putative Holocytochrome c-type synthase [Seiridium unicorne]|uniref:Holocytochrome c-type synthase n=1 Tax=Seiridium unicorne TaxID=138068 RepID=A0ABR2UJX5_9PEZI